MGDTQIDLTGTPAELRTRAARARLLARSLNFDEAAPRLLALAKALDARADAMEL